jgi:serine/threonine protein kinase/energy-coupling factor transporter ATP-binding protein EcfA2
MAAKLAPAIVNLLAEPPDQRRVGQFHLTEQLGRGSFAPVFLAREKLGSRELREVAVKLFAVTVGKGADAVLQAEIQRERIVEEARALMNVEHPNVVKFFTIATNDKHGVIGMVMEYVHGQSLDALIESFASRSDQRRIADLLDIGASVASALSAMHQRDLLHRDVKPANVIECAGSYKLIDFGIAAARRPVEGNTQLVVDDVPLVMSRERARELGGGSSGSQASSGGTPGYQDPACVARGEAPSPLSDLYALGALLFETASGVLPSVYANRLAGQSGVNPAVVRGDAAAPGAASAAPYLPAALAHLIDSLLQADPAKRPGSAEVVAWELEHIRAEIAGRTRARPPEEEGPFRGLGRFEQAHRDVYFGRTAEIAAGVQLLRARGVLAIVGPSGSGKSSLARAGILPAISEGALGRVPKAWTHLIMNPGADPHDALVAALEPVVPGARAMDPDRLIAGLAERAQVRNEGVALLIDQLEELVTVASGESQAFVVRFLSLLAAQPVFGVRAIVAARQDLLPELLKHRELGRALTRDPQLVAPMSDRMWSEVLDQALDAYGYRLEDDALRDELLSQLGGTDTSMPLVQFALTKLWQKRDTTRKIIPRAALHAIGGIAGALDVHADATYDHIARRSPDAAAVTRTVLLSLTTTKNTRATRTLEELKKRAPGELTPAVLRELEEARLVTHEDAGLTLAHEALIVQWGRLRGWLAEAREDRLLADEIEREAEGWTRNPHEERLWKKRRLIAAEDLVRRGNETVSDDARAFLRAGRASARRGLLTLIVAAGVLLVATAGATAWQVRNLSEARNVARMQAATAEDARKKAEASEKKAQGAEALAKENEQRAQENEKRAQDELAAVDAATKAMQVSDKAKTLAEGQEHGEAQRLAEALGKAQRLKEACDGRLAALKAKCNE